MSERRAKEMCYFPKVLDDVFHLHHQLETSLFEVMPRSLLEFLRVGDRLEMISLTEVLKDNLDFISNFPSDTFEGAKGLEVHTPGSRATFS